MRYYVNVYLLHLIFFVRSLLGRHEENLMCGWRFGACFCAAHEGSMLLLSHAYVRLPISRL